MPPQSTSASGHRRDFLKSSALATAATMAVASKPLNASVFAAGSELLKIGIIGCGGRGSGAAAQALSTDGPTKLTAMADAFRDRLNVSFGSLSRGLAQKSGKANNDVSELVDVSEDRRFVGLDAYRKLLETDIDVVILTGPPAYRPLHFEAAVAAGKHVFMEKPLATDAVGVKRILAASEVAKQKGLKVSVGLQRHHQQSYHDAIGRIWNGDIGAVQSMRCYWNTAAPAKQPIPRQGLTELEYQIRNWYFFAWLSGDHICEQHIHNLDVCNWVMKGHPVAAEGMGGRQVRTGAEYGNIFDHHAVQFTYADGTKMYSQCRQIPGCKKEVAEYIHGTDGVGDLGTVQCVLKQNDDVLWRSERKAPNPYQIEHDVLFKAIRTGTPHNEVENGAISTMTAILGRLATYSGKLVKWDEAYASELTLTTDTEDWSGEAPVLPRDDGSYAIPIPGVTRVI